MVPGLVLAAVVVSAAAAARFGRPAAVVLAGLCLLWLLVNHPMEGRVLVVVTAHHGLTAGDLAGLAGLVVAAYCFLRG